MLLSIFVLLFGLIGFAVSLHFDIRRRKLSIGRLAGWNPLSVLDVAGVASTIGIASALLIASSHMQAAPEALLSPAVVCILVCVSLLFFLWPEGRRQAQLQRPAGIVFAEWAILSGTYLLLTKYVAPRYDPCPILANNTLLIGGGLLLAGIGILAIIVPSFVKGCEEHRILDRIAAQGEFVQTEWAEPTPECPYPEKWHMVDAQSAEIEILALLKALVIATKPDLIVETGTFIGHSAINMAEGLRANGFGKIVTIEYDAAVFAKAKENIDASGLCPWIEYRHGSSLDANINGTIDLLYCDSDVNIRESEVRRFLPQVKTRGLVLIHDASSSFKVVREAAFRLEQEGLLSVLLLSTPRGLMIAQKREGRT